MTSLTVFTAPVPFVYGIFFFTASSHTYHIYVCTIHNERTIQVYCASNGYMYIIGVGNLKEATKKNAFPPERTKQQAFLLFPRFYSRMLLCVCVCSWCGFSVFIISFIARDDTRRTNKIAIVDCCSMLYPSMLEVY